MSKRKSPRFVEAEDKGRDSDENQNLGDEIKALKKDNLAKVQRLDEHEATIKSQEDRLKSQEAKLKRQEAELETQESCLAEEVTCMVCLDLPGPGKVPVCVNGHIICQICIRKLIRDQKNCPSCKGSLTPERFSLLANNICNMIQYSCPNKVLGCTVLPGRQGREDHMRNFCKYEKNIPCPGLKCPVKVSLADHRDHFLECFDTRYLQNNKIQTNRPKFRKGDFRRHHCYLISEDNGDDSFFLFVRQRTYEIVIRNVNRFAQYSVSCKIYDDETQVTRSFEGFTVPLGTPEDSSRYRNNCLKVPDCLIEHLEEEDGQRFYVDLKIEKLKN